MGRHTIKIKVIVASNNSLIANGIRAYIYQCGYDVDYLRFESLEDTLINLNHSNYYLIIHHQLLPENMEQLYREYSGKILIIGNKKLENNFLFPVILPSDTDKKIMEKLEDFFIEETSNGDDTNTSDVLSSREIEILKEVALGYSNKEIADRLYISINTVITHRKNITEKLGIKTIAGLTVYALMNNHINPNDVTI